MNKIIYFALALVLAVVSCSKSGNGLDSRQIAWGDEIQFSAASATRVEGSEWEADDLVGVSAGSLTNLCYDVDASSGVFSATGDKVYYTSDDDVVYTAYYPYNSSVIGSSYSVSLLDQSDFSAIDLLWAQCVTNQGVVEFEMEHKLVEIEITINAKNVSTDFTELLTGEIQGGYSSGYFDITTGEFSGFGSSTIVMKDPVIEGSVPTQRATFKALVLPSTDLSRVSFYFTCSERPFSYTPTDPNNEGWIAGTTKSYTIDVDFQKQATAIDVTPATATVNLYETLQLETVITPSDAVTKSVKWSSSDDERVTVSIYGLVEVIDMGDGSDVTITATVDGTTVSNTAIISLSKVAVDGISIVDEEGATLSGNDAQTPYKLSVGSEIQLYGVISPDTASIKDVEWAISSGSDYVTLVDGLLVGTAGGDAVITATAVDDEEIVATLYIEVYDNDPTSLEFANSSEIPTYLEIGDEYPLELLFDDGVSANKMGVTWDSTDPTAASVVDGVVTALAASASVTITATSTEVTSLVASATFEIRSVTASSITIATESTTLYIGGDVPEISVTFAPANTTNQTLNWSSTKEDVAYVDNDGTLVVVGIGEATISASNGDVTSNSITFTVEPMPIMLNDYLYADGSYGATYDSEKSLLGVVYELSDDAKSGKVVYVANQYPVSWGPETPSFPNTQPTSQSGLINMNEIVSYINDKEQNSGELTLADFPAFYHCDSLNGTTTATTYVGEPDNVWYLPSRDELKTLVGLALEPTEGTTNQLSDQLLNTRIKGATGGTGIVGGNSYVPSTEKSDKTTNYEYVRYTISTQTVDSYGASKTGEKNVRCVRKFNFAE